MMSWPLWAILITGFVVRDFIQWWVHRLLHSSEKLWQFHKVHHSVKEMGFAAHLRYHWMENVIYRSIEYIPLALLGIGLHDFFLIHIFTLMWGHYNHANFTVSSRVTGVLVSVGIAALVLFTGGFNPKPALIFGSVDRSFHLRCIHLGSNYEKTVQQSGNAHLASCS